MDWLSALLDWLLMYGVPLGTLAAAIWAVIASTRSVKATKDIPLQVQQRQEEAAQQLAAYDDGLRFQHWMREQRLAGYAAFLKASIAAQEALSMYARSYRANAGSEDQRRFRKNRQIASQRLSDLQDAAYTASMVSDAAIGQHVLNFVTAGNRHFNLIGRATGHQFPVKEAQDYHHAIRRHMRRDIQQGTGNRETAKQLEWFATETYDYHSKTRPNQPPLT